MAVPAWNDSQLLQTFSNLLLVSRWIHHARNLLVHLRVKIVKPPEQVVVGGSEGLLAD